MVPPVVAVIVVIAIAAYFLANRRAFAVAGGRSSELHSRPGYYASYAALLAAGPALALWAVWRMLEPSVLRSIVVSAAPPEVQSQSPEAIGFFMSGVRRVAEGLMPAGDVTPAMQAAAGYYGTLLTLSRIALLVAGVALATFCVSAALKQVRKDFRARNTVERWVTGALWLAAGVSIATTAGIVFSVLFEIDPVFPEGPDHRVPVRPAVEPADGAAGGSGRLVGRVRRRAAVRGHVPHHRHRDGGGRAGGDVLGDLSLAVCEPQFRATAKPILEILAGIPTVVYGFFAALTVAPLIRDVGEKIGLDVSSESALAAGLVMGIMIIPFVSSLADDAISAVPASLRDASFGLGATRAETITQVLIPAALPGIIAGFLLAISRAVGETMIVVMAAGLAANLTANPLQAVTTVTVQIVTLLVGDQEFDSAKTLSAFALGMVLFLATLMLNVIALYVMKTYREKYD